MSAAPVRLRGHHLLCILTYVGKGYSPGFVAAMDDVVARIRSGAAILLVDGPDDICAAHLADDPDPHCRHPGPAARDEAALVALGSLLSRTLVPGVELTLPPERLARQRAAFAAGSIRSACAGCEWADLCTDVAAGGFAATRLGPC